MKKIPEPEGRVLWLLPDPVGIRKCRNVIDYFAGIHNTPSFYPHLTLCRPHPDLSDSELATLADQFADRFDPVSVNLSKPECGTPPFQRFYAPVSDPALLNRMLNSAYSHFSADRDSAFKFHLSCLYGYLPCDQIDKSDLRLPNQLHIQSLAVVKLDAGPEGWRIIHQSTLGK